MLVTNALVVMQASNARELKWTCYFQDPCSHCKATKAIVAPKHLVIIDEASMVDLFLLSQVIKALGESARLILVGDVNQ
eukprot:scaffold60198_cov21-Tisochrysis_lutea.AAC.1